jgi:hypothetical protein
MIHSNIIFFQELVSEVEKTKNVVDATNQPNLYERLEALQGQLTLCEKALAEYLETKRLAFPRFYFVSSADLLDILSNGNNPPDVSSIYIDMIHSHLTQLEISSVFIVTNILYNKSFNWVMFV